MENLLTDRFIELYKTELSSLFTSLQLEILKKRSNSKPLDANERTYYYKFIKPRMNAILSFLGDNFILGREFMLEERIPKAEGLLSKFAKRHKGKRMLVSGSFLFNRAYEDIDLFIFSRYPKQDYRKEMVHVNFLPESSLESLFFSSLSQISVSNFTFVARKEFSIPLQDLLQPYELLVNHILNKDAHEKELRDFLIQTEYVSKNVILSPKQLFELKKRLQKPNILRIISEMFLNAVILAYDVNDMKATLNEQIKGYELMAKEYRESKNIGIYVDTYRKAIEHAA